MAVLLLDTFTGPSGLLTAHAPETGGAWTESNGDGKTWQLNGAGAVTILPYPGTGSAFSAPFATAHAYNVELDFTLLGSGSNVDGEFTLYLLDDNGNQHYVEIYSSLGSAGAYLGDTWGNGSGSLASLAAGAHTLRIEVSGTAMRALVDGVEIGTRPASGDWVQAPHIQLDYFCWSAAGGNAFTFSRVQVEDAVLAPSNQTGTASSIAASTFGTPGGFLSDGLSDQAVLLDNFVGANGTNLRTSVSGRTSDSGHSWTGNSLFIQSNRCAPPTSGSIGTFGLYTTTNIPNLSWYMEGELHIPTSHNSDWRAFIGLATSSGVPRAVAELHYTRSNGRTVLRLRTGDFSATDLATVDDAGINGSTGFGNPCTLPNPSILRIQDGRISLNGTLYNCTAGLAQSTNRFVAYVMTNNASRVLPAWEWVEGGQRVLLGAPQTGQATGFNTTAFGTPQYFVEYKASGFNSTAFGTPSGGRRFKAATMGRTTQFGVPFVTEPRAFQATGFCSTKFGQGIALRWLPPRDQRDRHFHAVGFNTTGFGTPSLG